MTHENDEDTGERFGRRAFLKTGIGAVAPVGLALGSNRQGGGQQDGGVRYLKMVLPASDIIRNDYVNKLVVITERTNDRLDGSEVENCRFPNWSPSYLARYRALLIDITDRVQAAQELLDPEAGEPGGATPGTANVAETNAFVDPDVRPVEPGTPLLTVGGHRCGDRYVGLTVHNVPPELRERLSPYTKRLIEMINETTATRTGPERNATNATNRSRNDSSRG